MARYSFFLHDFYCISCGQKNLSLPRDPGKLKGKFHRKKMYCRNCKAEVNHIECRDDFEAWEFEDNWRHGLYIQEASNSLEYCKENEDAKNIFNMRCSGIG